MNSWKIDTRELNRKYNADKCTCKVKSNGKFRMKCKLCEQEYDYNAYSSSTTSMNNHYQKHSTQETEQFLKIQLKKIYQKLILIWFMNTF